MFLIQTKEQEHPQGLILYEVRVFEVPHLPRSGYPIEVDEIPHRVHYEPSMIFTDLEDAVEWTWTLYEEWKAQELWIETSTLRLFWERTQNVKG